EGAKEFFAALVCHLPQLKALDAVRNVKNPEVTTAALREAKGGDLALRGVGMAIFARAFLYCKEEGIDYDVMAKKLATIDWHVLTCERAALPPGQMYGDELRKKALPMWSHLLVIGENKFKVSSSSTDVDKAWQNIIENV